MAQPNRYFKSMPYEIIYQICTYVNRTHRPTLQSLVLVNKRVRSVAIIRLFHSVTVTIDNPQQLSACLESTPKAVSENIRHLTIQGKFGQPGETETYQELKARKGGFPEMQDSFYDSASVLKWLEHIPHRFEADPPLWSGLVSMIKGIGRLSDLTFNCFNAFPIQILDALHSHHPHCRLHLNTFYISGLYGWDAPTLSEDDIKLITSPCLHSISSRYCYMDDDIPEYHFEAIMDMARGLSPGLKNVRLSAYSPGQGLGTSKGRTKWPGFGMDSQEEMASPHLDRLVLVHSIEVKSWSEVIDMSKLHCLEFGRSRVSDIQFLTSGVNFSGLEELVLDLVHWGDVSEPVEEYDAAISLFLRSLPPLKSLKVTGNLCQSTFECIIERHGGSLRKLHLSARPSCHHDDSTRHFVIREEQIQQIAKGCPLLEDLTIKIPRTQGDADEMAIYRALGSMPTVQNLYLTLDCSMTFFSNTDLDYLPEDDDYEARVPTESHFDAYDRRIVPMTMPNGIGIRRGHIRDTFVNSALDESLACSIFHAISSGKQLNSLPLEKLTVTTSGAFVFSYRPCWPSSFPDLTDRMRKLWLVQRNPRDDIHDRLVAKSLGEIGDDNDTGYSFGNQHQKEAKEIFLRLWPEKGDTDVTNNNGDQNKTWQDKEYTQYSPPLLVEEWQGSWRDNWHSFPLQQRE